MAENVPMDQVAVATATPAQRPEPANQTAGGPPVVFRPDGTVWLQFDRGLVRLRRPKLRELRVLREELQAILDVHNAAAEGLRVGLIEDAQRELEWLGIVNGDTATHEERAAASTEIVAQKAARRASNLDWSVHQEDDYAGWVQRVIAELAMAGSAPADNDELDAYMAQQSFVLKLVEHWQTVPLGSGG